MCKSTQRSVDMVLWRLARAGRWGLVLLWGGILPAGTQPLVSKTVELKDGVGNEADIVRILCMYPFARSACRCHCSALA